jgi:hypothetical protein
MYIGPAFKAGGIEYEDWFRYRATTDGQLILLGTRRVLVKNGGQPVKNGAQSFEPDTPSPQYDLNYRRCN